MTWGGSIRGTGTYIEDDVGPRATSDLTLLRRLVRYLRVHRKEMAYVSLSVVVFTIATGVGPILTGDAIDWYIFPNGSLGNNVMGLAEVILVFVGVNVAMYLAENAQTFYMARAGQGVIYTLRKEAFDKLQRLSLNYFNEKPIGAVISHVTNDVDVLNDFLSFQSTQLISGFFSIAGIAIVMFVINVRLALYSLTMIPLLFILIYALQGRIKQNWMNTRRTMGALNAKVAESLAGIKVTQSFAAEGDDRNEFVTANYRNMLANVQAGKLSSFIAPMARVIQALSIFAVFYFGAVMVAGGQIQVGILAAFYLWLNNLFRPVQQLTQFYPQYQSALTGLDRVLQIIDAEVDVKESPSPVNLERVDGRVDFNDVYFKYKTGDANALAGIDVHVAPKETVAIVGQTGAGKTTFVNLLLRFYDPDRGEILLDGHDIGNLTFRSLRGHMAIVLQDPFLFSNTIMENIRYGNLSASDEDIVKAAKDVGLHEFVMSLPEAYNTQIRESANNISTGQKQLLSLARALVADPRILILDEATSKVDPHTELLIQRGLERVFNGRTTFIIAHRLSTIRMAQRILVLDHGKIVEQGLHEELLLKGGTYARVYRMQFEDPRPVTSRNVTPRSRLG